MIEEHDEKMTRCPRIGGDVNFKFCRSENNMLPCRWVVGCWEGRIDISRFLDEHFSQEAQNRIFVPPKPKIESLVEMIEKAKQSK
ncbi:MAG: hypothetical protein JRH06_12580 [Deltaproteobacteria bacterium]|nr:hypothetical protein [Deltaproteobacteria bacterium]